MPFDFHSRTSTVVAGAAVVLSIVHYMKRVSTVKHNVPLHFGITGTPSQFVHRMGFVVYPLLVTAEAGFLLMIRYLLRKNMYEGNKALENDIVEDTLVMYGSLVATLVAQVYAGLIGAGEATQMPSVLPTGLVMLVCAPFVMRLKKNYL